MVLKQEIDLNLEETALPEALSPEAEAFNLKMSVPLAEISSPSMSAEKLESMARPLAEDETIAERRKEWFKKADCEQKTKRDWRYAEGVAAGYVQAAEDYIGKRVTEETLEEIKIHSVTDFHAIGFQVGYLRKLVEIFLF